METSTPGFHDLLAAASRKLLDLFQSSGCRDVELVVLDADHVDVFHGIPDSLVVQSFLHCWQVSVSAVGEHVTSQHLKVVKDTFRSLGF